jgi:hypothetical protein
VLAEHLGDLRLHRQLRQAALLPLDVLVPLAEVLVERNLAPAQPAHALALGGIRGAVDFAVRRRELGGQGAQDDRQDDSRDGHDRRLSGAAKVCHRDHDDAGEAGEDQGDAIGVAGGLMNPQGVQEEDHQENRPEERRQ